MSTSQKLQRVRSQNGLRLESLENRQLLAADLVGVAPQDDALFVDAAVDITLEFNENISPGIGAVAIYNASDDSVVEAFDVATSDRLSFDGAVLTIDPTADLAVNSSFYVTVDSGAIVFESETLLLETFDELPLEPFIAAYGSPTEADWTAALPDGWTRDNMTTPTGATDEYFGFTVMNKDSWLAEQGGQGRANFTKGSGSVLVADPDAFDDLVGIEPDLFNVFAQTAAIDLSGQPADSVTLQFDSSFRPYDGMTGLVDVSYDDGATWENLLTLETSDSFPNSSLDRVNETVSFDLANPADGEVLVRFGMTNAGNDWWWAVDNVVVEARQTTNPDVYGGFDDPETFNFSTGPAVEATTDTLTLTFLTDVKVTEGAGDFTIVLAEDGSTVEVIPANSDRVSVSGAQITLDPVADLQAGVDYLLEIDDLTVFDTSGAGSSIVIYSEDFESLPLQDSMLVGTSNNVDDYVVVMRGVLDVQTAGEYTFGTTADDSSLLFIDLNQNGLDLGSSPDGFDSFDTIISDPEKHGRQSRFSTCPFGEAAQTCEDGFGFILAEGQYEFEFWSFDEGGAGGAEFWYAPGLGYGSFKSPTMGDAKFVLIGDASQGIGVTEDGITATTYLSTENIGDWTAARDLVVNGTNLNGDPISAKIPTADVANWANNNGAGFFADDHDLPGFPNGEDLDWSPAAPDGWARETNIELGRTRPEFDGWAFQDKEFWIAQQGGQGRDQFTIGEGVVAIVDGDAADDFGGITNLSSYLTMPAFDLAGEAADSLSLIFDSSFRPYDAMTGLVDVSYDDGATWENLLTLETSEALPNSSTDRINETVTLDLGNPDAGEMLVRFGMENANNDWWWAIDNVRIAKAGTGSPIPGTTPEYKIAFSVDEVAGLTGDYNNDGMVDLVDFNILKENFGGADDVLAPGTSNGDGVIDLLDFNDLKANFGASAAAVAFAQLADDSDDTLG